MQQIDQEQSPIFRIPREIRDEIYEHYAHEDQGLFYDHASRKLRYADKAIHEDRIGLICSCKIAVDEMQDVAMRANTVTFVPARSENDGAKCYGLRSRAGRFERLLQASRRMKMHILHYVAKAGCVTDRMADQVAARYPSIARYYRTALAAIQTGGEELEFWHMGDYMNRWQMSASFCDAVHHTLELASSHPVFDDIASEACSTPLSAQGTPCPFIPGSHSTLLGWKPDYWLIPAESDLALESLLMDPSAKDRVGYTTVPEPLAPVAWYFSATSVAIDFLKRLNRYQRLQIRGKIVIDEHMRGAAYPESHAKGLIPFCHENPRLRVEMRVGFWTNLVPSIWLRYPSHYDDLSTIGTLEVLGSFADWIDETTSLHQKGMPIDAFTAILEGQTKDTLQVWTMIKHAAALQEDMLASDYLRQHPDIDLRTIDEPLGGTADQEAFSNRLQLPCDLPPSFSRAIRQIIAGTGIIRFDGDPDQHHPDGLLTHEAPQWAIHFGEIMSTHKETPTRQDWSPQDFYDAWYNLGASVLQLPYGGVPAIMQRYELQALRHKTELWVWEDPDRGDSFEYSPQHPELQWVDG